jgi:hypothetical protein
MTDALKKPNWFKRHKVITGILAILAIFMIIGAMGDSSTKQTQTSNSTGSEALKTETTEKTSNAKPTAEPKSYEPVDTKSLITEFDENQLAAEKKYKNKLVQLRAKIGNISEDIVGTPFLSLKPTSESETYFGTTIKCSFKDSDSITAVKKGEIVTVNGEVASQSIGIIQLNDCQLVQ